MADGEVGGVAVEDAAAFVFHHPFVIGDQAWGFADEGESGAFAEAEAAGEGEEVGGAGVDADLVEPGVAGAGDGAADGDGAFGGFAPVVERVVADADGGGAVDGGIGLDRAVVEGGEGDDGFEG